MTNFELTDEYLNKLRQAISAGDEAFVKEQLQLQYAQDIAQIMNHLELSEIQYLYKRLDETKTADVLIELDEDLRERFLDSLTSKEIAEQLIDNMDSDDAADVIAELSDEKQEEVLSHIEDTEQASDIVDLLNYDQDTAGGLMAKEFIRVHVNKSLTECVREIREQSDKVDNVYAIYVVDDDEKLIGLLPVKKLIVSPVRTNVSDIYNPEVISVRTSTPREEVAGIMEKYDLVMLPVVDGLGRLVGKITIDDVVDVIREEAGKDIQMMSGITGDVEVNDNVWSLSKVRIPWLLVGLAGGILGSRIIGTYENQIQIHPEMAFFIPLIGAMGGNVGVQSSAIVVQGLANNTILGDKMVNKLVKELSVGLVNGLICSLLILSYNLVSSESFNLSFTVSAALMTVIMVASFLGTFVPLSLHRMKLDPALATGPFVTTLNDIIGMFVYFLIGRLLYA